MITVIPLEMSSVLCLICQRSTAKLELLGHIAQHLNYFPHKCRVCSFKTTDSSTLTDHQMETNHGIAINVSPRVVVS